MAQTKYRGNLSAKWFPFISEWFGRSVIVQANDQNFNRQVTSDQDLDKDRGIPQVYYCHNIMPSAEGLQSVGYLNPVVGSYVGMNNIITLRAVDGSTVLFARDSSNNSYVCAFGSSTWTSITSAPGTSGVPYTTATINGQTYIMYANVGLYTYTAGALVHVGFTGLVENTVLGITSSFGYMIAYTTTSIAWSSTLVDPVVTDPIDFTPSQLTGAGGGAVQAIKGKITLCLSHFLGFIIYTNINAIAAVYSGNVNYPFNFREIVGSGGLAGSNLIDYDPNSGNHYAYTTSGIQLVSVSATQTVMPEATDFLAGKYFEDFNESTLAFTSTILTSPMKKNLTIIADRYMVLSYGVNSLTHALVYDVTMKRYGKLKVNHNDCFEYRVAVPETIDNPRDSIAFMQDSGSIVVVDFNYGSSVGDGVLILGKYQFVRESLLQLQEVNLENIRAGNSFNCYDMTTLDGKTLQTPVAGYLSANSGSYRKYSFHLTGINHSLLLIGNFFLDSIELAFNIHGKR